MFVHACTAIRMVRCVKVMGRFVDKTLCMFLQMSCMTLECCVCRPGDAALPSLYAPMGTQVGTPAWIPESLDHEVDIAKIWFVIIKSSSDKNALGRAAVIEDPLDSDADRRKGQAPSFSEQPAMVLGLPGTTALALSVPAINVAAPLTLQLNASHCPGSMVWPVAHSTLKGDCESLSHALQKQGVVTTVSPDSLSNHTATVMVNISVIVTPMVIVLMGQTSVGGGRMCRWGTLWDGVPQALFTAPHAMASKLLSR